MQATTRLRTAALYSVLIALCLIWGQSVPTSIHIPLGAAVALAQTTLNVLNPASDLNGRTLLTAEGNYTVSGTHTFSGVPRFPTGTAGSPGIVPSSDTTTGWQMQAGSIGGSLSGTQRFKLDGTGLTIYGTLVVNNAGTVTGGVPSGAIVYFDGACPSGYAEFTNARGNYIVGLVSGGTLHTQVGTALTDQENRATGQHNHAITDPGHTHPVISFNHNEVDGGGAITSEVNQSGGVSAPNAAGTNTTGISVNNAGSVAGTNAPYIQLRVCQKT